MLLHGKLDSRVQQVCNKMKYLTNDTNLRGGQTMRILDLSKPRFTFKVPFFQGGKKGTLQKDGLKILN